MKIAQIESNVLKSIFESFVIKTNSFLICVHEQFSFQNSFVFFFFFNFSHRSELGDSSYDFSGQGRWRFFQKLMLINLKAIREILIANMKYPFVKLHLACRKINENFSTLAM